MNTDNYKNKTKKIRLIEFQENLNKEILKEQGSVLFIGVKENGCAWLIALEDLKETSVVKNIAKIGLTKDWIIGVANFKGHVHMVVDMKYFLAGVPTKLIVNKNIITVLHKKFANNIGLLWGEVDGIISDSEFVRELREDEIDKILHDKYVEKNNLNNIQKDKRRNLIEKAFLDVHKNTWFLLDIKKLVEIEDIINIQK